MKIDIKRIKRKKSLVRSNQFTLFDRNEDLLAIMYKTYSDKLYAYGLSLHSDTSIIEDAIHDVLISVYTNEKRLVHINNLKQYLFTAFRNRLFYLLQGKKRFVRNIHEIHDLFTEKPSYEVWIESEEENDKKKMINHLLSDLTQHQREAVHLRFIDGLPINEIAKIMQINYQSAKTLVHRAISKIRSKHITSSHNTD